MFNFDEDGPHARRLFLDAATGTIVDPD